MKVALIIHGMPPESYAPIGKKADDLGYDLLLVVDHHAPPVEIPRKYPYTETGEAPFNPSTPWLDPMMALTYLAGATKRIRLGTYIYILPLRHPISAAREITTLDVLSNGRVSLGVGTGWMREEFEAVDKDFDNRGKRTEESLEIMKRLWTQESVEFKGEHYSFAPMTFYPKSVQKPHPPIHFGGETPVVLRRAARMGDGWMGMGHSPESAKEYVQRLDALRLEYGREKEPFEVTVNCAVPATVDNLRRFEEVGVHRVIASLWGRDPIPGVQEMGAALESFADQVLSKL